MSTPRVRSNLPRDEARRRYVELAELAVLEQIRADAAALDGQSLAIGPFARLDAGAVAAREGKTRGAVNNLFGSQAALQIETMAYALEAADLVGSVEYPAPADHETDEAWVAAFFAAQSARGPAHGADPALDYAALWALWLATVPYGVWSERVSGPSMEEYRGWIADLERTLRAAIDHFGRELDEGTTITDLATAAAALIEGAWLNQCLTGAHPAHPAEPAAEALRRSGRLLWRGATRAR